jgi:type I restriction enzyme S subunit
MTFNPLSRVPFSHPWPEKLMRETAAVVVGGTPSTDVSAYWNGDIAWMASGDVHQKHITEVEGRITRLV